VTSGPSSGTPGPALDPDLRVRLAELQHEGREIWDRFDTRVRRHEWHPFVPADYETVLRALLPLRAPGRRFLEWGSATGVVTIMADLLGFDACGIEIDHDLVAIARDLAARFDSAARFGAGSFLPAGYEWRSPTGDRRLGTIGLAPSAYPSLGRSLDEFDIVFAYPWGGEEPIMKDVMRAYGARDALLLLHGAAGVQTYVRGRPAQDAVTTGGRDRTPGRDA
jgi:hypothetical protein